MAAPNLSRRPAPRPAPAVATLLLLLASAAPLARPAAAAFGTRNPSDVTLAELRPTVETLFASDVYTLVPPTPRALVFFAHGELEGAVPPHTPVRRASSLTPRRCTPHLLHPPAGCAHSGGDWFPPSDACPQCLGLPEELSHTRQASQGCWLHGGERHPRFTRTRMRACVYASEQRHSALTL